MRILIYLDAAPNEHFVEFANINTGELINRVTSRNRVSEEDRFDWNNGAAIRRSDFNLFVKHSTVPIMRDFIANGNVGVFFSDSDVGKIHAAFPLPCLARGENPSSLSYFGETGRE